MWERQCSCFKGQSHEVDMFSVIFCSLYVHWGFTGFCNDLFFLPNKDFSRNLLYGMQRGVMKLSWAGDCGACSALFCVISYQRQVRAAYWHLARPNLLIIYTCLHSEVEEDPFYEVKITHHLFLCPVIFNSFEKMLYME